MHSTRRAVLHQIALGFTNAKIARNLGKHESTIKWMIHQEIYPELGLEKGNGREAECKRAHAVYEGMRRGIIA